MWISLRRYTEFLLLLPRAAKIITVLCADTSFCVITVWLAFYMRLGEFVTLTGSALFAAEISVILALPVFILSGLYRSIFRYSGLLALTSVAWAVAIYGSLYASIFTVIGVPGIPRTIGIIQPAFLLLFVGASRVLAGFWLGDNFQRLTKDINRPKALIYGAGAAGRQLAAGISDSVEMQIVGFLDDDKRLHGHLLNGLPIYNPNDLSTLAETQAVSDVLLALPSVSRKRRNEILTQIRGSQVSVRTLPSVSDLARGKVTVSDIHELDIDDLLGRETVSPNQNLLAKNISKKTVMVTGAGGSIGSELCRQISALGAAKILLVDQSEYALYVIHQELENKQKNVSTVPLLASVQDEDRLREIMLTWRPQTVYHAAAYKHVPLVEHNLAEGVKNNVFGTLKTAKAAISQNVDNFVFISTDKAVRPSNIMGASKRLSEILLQALAAENPSVNFSMVRFGNVLGSSGSVVPKFRQQIRNGGPITITHPKITRFFMTIPEAAQLVIQAGAMAKGGDVFVLDMGKPVKIIELARRMISLSGLTLKDNQNPDGDIEIEITGLRPGEKLYEELLIGSNPQKTSHRRIMKAHEEFLSWGEVEVELEKLATALNENNIKSIYASVKKLVPDYNSSKGIVDWIYMKQSMDM